MVVHILDLPTDLIRHELFKTVVLDDFSKLRIVCKECSRLPWNLTTRTHYRRPRNPTILNAQCVVHGCCNRRLNSLVWNDRYVPQLPYCRLHADPYMLQGIDVYCYHSVSPDVMEQPGSPSPEPSL